MRILVLSDTHGDKDAIDRLLNKEYSFDRVFHLGDNVRDAHYIEDSTGLSVDSVPGNCDYSGDSTVSIVTVKGKRFMLTHGHTYNVGLSLTRLCFAAEEQECDAVLFGHTHTPLLDYCGKITVLNPGSISRPRRSPACYAVITIDEAGVMRVDIRQMQ